MDEVEFKTGIRPATPEEAAHAGEPAGITTPEQPEETTPDGEEPRDPEAEDDGEDEGPGAPVDDSPRVHTITVQTHATHTSLIVRFFHEGEGWIVRNITLAENATAKMVAEALADLRSWA